MGENHDSRTPSCHSVTWFYGFPPLQDNMRPALLTFAFFPSFFLVTSPPLSSPFTPEPSQLPNDSRNHFTSPSHPPGPSCPLASNHFLSFFFCFPHSSSFNGQGHKLSLIDPHLDNVPASLFLFDPMPLYLSVLLTPYP